MQKSFKIFAGILLAIIGAFLTFYDWFTGSGRYDYSTSFSLTYLSFLLCLIGAFIVRYNYRNNLPDDPKIAYLHIRRSVLTAFLYTVILFGSIDRGKDFPVPFIQGFHAHLGYEIQDAVRVLPAGAAY